MFVLVPNLSAYKPPQRRPQQTPKYRAIQISFVGLGGFWKSRVWQTGSIWETLNLLTCLDSSTDTKTDRNVACHMLPITNANIHSHSPPPANSPIMYSRLVRKDQRNRNISKAKNHQNNKYPKTSRGMLIQAINSST